MTIRQEHVRVKDCQIVNFTLSVWLGEMLGYSDASCPLAIAH